MRPADPLDPMPALETLLRWYVDMGVDAAIDAAPNDRFASPAEPPAARVSDSRVEPTPAARTQAPPPIRSSEAGGASEDLIREAEALAAGARDLDDLLARWQTVPGCALGRAARFIADPGAREADVMLLAAAPEEDDERAGQAFAGAHGRLLDNMLAAIGLARGQVALAHVVPWRPPGGRAPTPLEIAVNLPFARRRIALAQARLVLCLGERAAQPLLETKDSVGRLRGRWFDVVTPTHGARALVTFSPLYLLKQPLQKRLAWADLQLLAAARTGA